MKKITLLAMSLFTTLFVNAQYGVDITSQVTNPDFEDGTTGWTLSGGYWAQPTAAENGYSGKNFVEHWVAAPGTLPNLDCYQTIEVENGLYVLTVLAHAIQQDNSSLEIVGVEVYANKDAAIINTISASEYKVATVVEDGKLKVGYRAIETNANWIGWDNIRITQYAAGSIDEAKVMYAKDEMKILATTAEELMAGKIQLALAEAIAANIELIETVATAEEAQALWDELKAQIAEAKASAEAYISLQAKIDQAYEWMEKDLPEGYDEFEAAIATAESNYEEAPLNVEETKAATTALDNAIFDFFMLNANGELEFPMTDLYVTNPTVRSTNTGWTYNPESAKATVSYNIAEFYNKDYDMSQTIEGLPNGMYVVSVTGYYRATGNDSNVGFNAHEDGSEVITAVLYANNNFVPLACLYEHNIEEINASEPTDKTIGGYNNFANSMAEAEVCFDKGFYGNNAVTVIVQDGKLTFGIRDQNHGGGSWTAFRDFNLSYRGNFPAVVLSNTLAEAEAWLEEHTETLPATAYNELSDAISEASDYTTIGDYENDEVMVVIGQFDSIYASVKNVVTLQNKLVAMVADVENLLTLNYPGLEALAAAYEVASDLTEAGFEPELAEGQNTEMFYAEAVAALQAAINAYYESQVATPENPADYTHRVGLPNFQATKNYTIPAPWVIDNVQKSGDVWVGTCQPEETGGAGLPGLNSWSNDFTTMDVHQDIEGLPNGVYTVTAKAITQGLGQQHAYAKSSVGTSVSEDMTIVGWDTPEWETLTTAKVVVVDGKLRIGFASVSAGGVNGWYQVTGFKLYYYGEASEDDLKAAWEYSLAHANEYAEVLLPGDSKDVKAAIASATPLAEEGKYTEACQALNPVVATSDSVFNVTKKFYDGNYAQLEEVSAQATENGCEYVGKVVAAALQFAGTELEAEDATYAILAALDEKLAGYAEYASYLLEAETTIATTKAFSATDVTFVKDNVIAPQVADLVAKFRTKADCQDLLAKLQKAMNALNGTLNLKHKEGDATDLIVNPTIDDSNANGWTAVKGTGNGPTNAGEHYDGTTANRYIDSWAGSGLNFTAYQEILGLPDGTYELTVATRTDGDNAYVFAAPQPLEADTAAWTASTQWAMFKNYGAFRGEIWYADSLAWVASEGTIEAPYYNARNGEGFGWSYDTITVEVTQHYLAIGVTANHLLTGQAPFTGAWIGADDWKLTLVKKAETQSEFNPFTGVENIEAVAPVMVGIYDLFGRRVETPTVSGIYIVNGKKVVIKK